MRRNILLIVKEALNNIVKYSDAAEVNLKISQSASKLLLSLEDNGKGFDQQTAHKGNGLQNIRYRVQQCGGTVSIISAVNAGTAIHCKFPITTISDKI
jgi:signal transduction histidine kinase